MFRSLKHLLAALGALMLLVTFTPAVRWWAQALNGPWDESRAGTLIVLAADVVQMDTAVIGERSYWRCNYAALLWRSGRFRKFLISGDSTASEPMRQFLVAAGIPAEAIRLEPRSHSTRENALFTAELLRGEKEPLTLLSSDFHMRRALGAFHKAGLTVRSEPMPDAGKRYQNYAARWPAFLDLCGETAKLVWYKLRGWA